MGTVAVAVDALAADAFLGKGVFPHRDAVGPADDVQIGMFEVDAGVDHRHVGVDPHVVRFVDVEIGIGVAEGPFDAGGGGLGRHFDPAVRDDILDLGVLPQSLYRTP
ncbi:MAG TPA: hypothetical protein VFM94_03125 [Solirubrobacterales bacterium]|nr:hypothetical protein [Solirubrobacterales bacterium]